MRSQYQAALTPDQPGRFFGRQVRRNRLLKKQPDQVSVGRGDFLADDHMQAADGTGRQGPGDMVVIGDCDAIDAGLARGLDEFRWRQVRVGRVVRMYVDDRLQGLGSCPSLSAGGANHYGSIGGAEPSGPGLVPPVADG